MTRSQTSADPDAGADWFACYTRSRHEKKVRLRLERQGLESFLPLVTRERQWHDRTATVDWPMFPGYVFARVDRQRLDRLVDTPGLVTVISFGGKPAPIPDEEIESVRRFARGLQESDLEPERADLPPKGRKVRVLRGPLEGVVGTVREHRGDGRVLVVGLEAIRQGLKVELDAGDLEVLGPDA